jgi:hypothetical protein
MGIGASAERGMAPGAHTEVAVPSARVSVKAREELRGQLDSAIGFADLCAFLTAGECSDRASQLVDLAERLFAETMQALGRAPAPTSATTTRKAG